MEEWIARMFQNGDLLRMGHCQRREDLNLGMGWLYYGLARLLRPRTVVVIGSWRGFSPVVFAKALADNVEQGTVHFVDPSLVDGFWKDPDEVRRHFASHGAGNVRHHLMTTQEFVETDTYRDLGEVGLLFVDGYHSEEQARFDYEAFAPRLAPAGLALFHDSVEVATVSIYGAERAYERRVKFFLDELKRDDSLQVFDLPFANGLTFVRRA